MAFQPFYYRPFTQRLAGGGGALIFKGGYDQSIFYIYDAHKIDPKQVFGLIKDTSLSNELRW